MLALKSLAFADASEEDAEAAGYPAGDYVTALLRALADAEATTSAQRGCAKRSRQRGRRRESLLDRMRLHSEYLTPAIEAEMQEEVQCCEARLLTAPDVLQVRPVADHDHS